MKNLPTIKFQEFFKRIHKYLKPEISTIIIALIYIDKVSHQKKNNIILIENNIFKLFLCALICAIKYNEDIYDDNNYYAKVGGIRIKEMNLLEKEFLNLMDFRMFVSSDVYEKYYSQLKLF